MSDPTTITPLATIVTFAFAALVVGGLVLYLVMASRGEKK